MQDNFLATITGEFPAEKFTPEELAYLESRWSEINHSEMHNEIVTELHEDIEDSITSGSISLPICRSM